MVAKELHTSIHLGGGTECPGGGCDIDGFNDVWFAGVVLRWSWQNEGNMLCMHVQNIDRDFAGDINIVNIVFYLHIQFAKVCAIKSAILSCKSLDVLIASLI